jgi:arylsulfatase A-like enzyme
LFTKKALEFIDREHKEPFFLYLAFTIPHYELTIPEDEKTQYYQKSWPLREMKMGHYRHDENGHVTYASMVNRMDKDIGKILNKLQEKGIADNTLVIFTSDNGHQYDHVNDEFFNSNSLFRGKKRDLYEGGIRVPFVAYWPGKIAAGTESSHVSAFWDFLPTACDIAGIKPTSQTDGLSYLPTLLGNEEAQKTHEYLYWEFNEGQGPIQAILKNGWKLVNFVDGPTELYHIAQDPSEKQNLISQYPEKAENMKSMLKQVRWEHPEFPLTKRERNK